MIKKANISHTQKIALIHQQELKSGFLSLLGVQFLKDMYIMIIKQGILLVSVDELRIDGFVSFSPNTRRLMVGFLISNPMNFIRLFIQFFRHPVFLRKSLETFLAPFKSSHRCNSESDLPSAELLSIGVESTIQKSGIGSQLLMALESEIRGMGIGEYKVIAGVHLVSANNFYLKNGFTRVMQVTIHGNELSNVYVKKL